MRILPLVVLLLAASPAYSQSRLYTNADLGRPLSSNRRTVTPDELDALRAHQFVYVPPARPIAPGVFVVGSSPTDGPFGAFTPLTAPRRLDGTAYTDPPWSMTAYVGWPYLGWPPLGDGSGVSTRTRRDGVDGPTPHRRR